MMKLELTCPSGLRSAISSGCGRVAGASPRAAEKFAAQFDSGMETACAAPIAKPGSKEKRCAMGCSGAEVRSKPPSDPTPDPRPTSSMPGIIARGTSEDPSAGTLPGEAVTPSAKAGNVPNEEPGEAFEPFAEFPAPVIAPAAAAKLAIGRVLINAWRMASRVKSCTNC